MQILYLLSLDQTFVVVMWGALVEVGAFYMQRLHYETLTEWGTEVRAQKLLSLSGRALGAAAFIVAAYLVYRVGIMAGIIALVVMFAAPIAVSTLDVWLLRSPARPMALAALPVTVFAFAMMLRAAAALS